MSYRIKKIFYTIQGEGYWSGNAAVFARFSGCHRSCRWCDTDFSGGEQMDAIAIADNVAKYGCRHIVLTGGEPCIQVDAELIGAIRGALPGAFLQIETAGDHPYPAVDWLTVSPKTPPGKLFNDWRRADELKLVYPQDGISPEMFAGQKPRLKWLQPCDDGEMTKTHMSMCVDYVMANPEWRISVQTHKVLGCE